MASGVRNMRLTSLDELFSSEETRQEEARKGEQVLSVPIDEVHDFVNNPYKVRHDAELMDMAESISRIGVHTPCIVRSRKEGGYELLSGHRRKAASIIAGQESIPVIVKDVDDDTATIIVVDGNIQRETILPSEKAFAYKMKLEAMKRQGERTDLTSAQVGRKFRGKESREILAEQVGESKNQIQRYIRLTNLIPELLEMVDDKKIAFGPAVELSYIPEELQRDLLDVMDAEESTPSLSQAQRMKAAAQAGKLDRNGMELVMQEEKPQANNITIRSNKLDKYIPRGYTPKQREDYIIKACETYHRLLQRKKQKEER